METRVDSYRHTQVGWYVWGVSGAALAVWLYIGVMYDDLAMYILSGLFSLALVLFSTLTVRVEDGRVAIAFGIGLISKAIPMEEIDSARTVRNRWWYGWGIRLMPGGWLYNVSGLDAVELSMKDGKVYRIGTNEPQALLEAIEKRLGQDRPDG